jgi:hypothetical protein
MIRKKGQQKMFKDKFDQSRRLAWIRSKCQANFRGELWNLTWEEFCHFWSDLKLWRQRGRAEQDLVLTRYDPEGAWDRDNCCIINRKAQLTIGIKRKWNLPEEEFYKDAIWYEK